ncbi:hypothetical protein P280DRAFT_485870 [Massarina eburnea CBS 473.64]|uniref:F-box domain-containing protein n=1 Tax=Massarina eburnea CBS 473.64 TaxID=1395130 RepID=A0A6A6SE65_9PLEO|nr:hypothetical protein P280DRAFT_485870 [Massarina eburnea CBS 473.64]
MATPTLPRYLARHVELGFDSDDVDAFIDSIEASQDPQSSTLPHLPAEILFQIVSFLPLDSILHWRLVCRGVRDYIDGPFMKTCLKKAELIGYLGTDEEALGYVGRVDYDEFRFLRAGFDVSTTGSGGIGKWNEVSATFQIDTKWMRWFSSRDAEIIATQTNYDINPWRALVRRLELQVAEECHGTLRWCLRIDNIVLDLELPVEVLSSSNSMHVDLRSGKIVLQWRRLLFRFLKVATMFRKLLDEVGSIEPSVHQANICLQKEASAFTFGHFEDCLRSLRRQLLRSAVNINHKDFGRVKWEMNLLCPLFGKRKSDTVAPSFNMIGNAEDDAVKVLTFIRKEATMSKEEKAFLQELNADLKQMDLDLEDIQRTFLLWTSDIYGASWPFNLDSTSLRGIANSPAAWTDSQRALVETRVQKWRRQNKTITQVLGLMESSREVMSLPENAFDDVDDI